MLSSAAVCHGCIPSTSFPLALGKHFQTSGISTWWALSFSCRRLHTMPMQSRTEMGSIHRLTTGRSINRCQTRKQLENSQDNFWHDSHTCCIEYVTQVVNFGSKWLISYASVHMWCDEELDGRFSEYSCILETQSNLQILTNEIPPFCLYAE